MSVTELQFQTWLATFFWPFLRVGAMVAAAPIFNSRQVPIRLRLLLALVLTWVIAPGIPPVPTIDPFSFRAVLTAVQEIFVGVAMGFVLQMALSAMVFGGQVIAHKMGLGFAQMVDPQNGVQVPVLSQYYLILATFLFLLVNGHLLLIELLAQGFSTLPIGESLSRADFRSVVAWGSEMFAGGLLVALPAVGALMLVNLGFGIMTRAAPQLHIFAVGFPLAILIGFGLVWLTLPGVMSKFTNLLEGAFGLVRTFMLIGS
jgi:flagellar biosynthetic protein FliR